MINIQNLTKVFNNNGENFYALEKVDLSIKSGEIFGIIGLSGAGKSTLIRCLNRLEEPTEGKIFMDNTEVTSLEKDELRELRKSISMIFQHFNLLSSKTVYENVAFPLELEGINKKEISTKVNNLLNYVGLEDKMNTYPSQLSGGQKQRVAIARALVNEPKVLLSDEGTSALDPQTTNSILNLLKQIRDELGVTIVLITHEMEVVKNICDRVAIMEDGQIIEINTVEELFKNPKTKRAKSFIDNLKLISNEDIVLPNNEGKLLRLSYSDKNAKKPIVSTMVKNFNLDVNILAGNINELNTTSIGHLIVQLNGKNSEIENAIKWLKKQSVNIEVIK